MVNKNNHSNTSENKEQVILTIKFLDKENNVIDSQIKEFDLVVNTGLSLRASLLGNISTPIALDAIAVGTGTTAPAVTDSALVTEVERVTSTNSIVTTNVTDDTCEIVGTIAFTASYAISEVATFNSATASAGIMYSRDTIGPYNVVSGTSLQFTFKFVQTS